MQKTITEKQIANEQSLEITEILLDQFITIRK